LNRDHASQVSTQNNSYHTYYHLESLNSYEADMHSTQLLTAAVVFGLAPFFSPVGAATKNPQLVAQLKAAGTQADRLELLPNDETDWTFDFAAQEGYTFEPASVINANIASWPVCSAFLPPFYTLPKQKLLSLSCIILMPSISPDRSWEQTHNGHDPVGSMWNAASSLSPESIQLRCCRPG
jgi:hypothetical protein